MARFGGIPLRRQPHAPLVDLPVTIKRKPARNELLKRLLANTCELCQSPHQVEVHHIRKLADSGETRTSSKTTLGTCDGCPPTKDTDGLSRMSSGHSCGQTNTQTTRTMMTGEPCNGKLFSTVRRGTLGKGQSCTSPGVYPTALGHYVAETLIENRLDAPLKPIVGTNHGRKRPRFKTNDTAGSLSL